MNLALARMKIWIKENETKKQLGKIKTKFKFTLKNLILFSESKNVFTLNLEVLTFHWSLKIFSQ